MILICIVSLTLLLCLVEGFVVLHPVTIHPSRQQQNVYHDIRNTLLLRLSSSSANDVSGMGDLTSALARLDQKWEIQQRKEPKSRWTKLILKNDNDNNTKQEEEVKVENDTTSTTMNPDYGIPPPQSYTATSPISQTDDYVYLLEPPYQSVPSCLITFTGGAGLGTYPQIAYNELLVRISNKLNAAIITAPYQVGLDHFQIAKDTGEKTRKAILQCQDDPNLLYSTQLPVYSLSHSLGGKLTTIYLAATDQQFDGIGMISFNNFGFGQTIGMARKFAETIRQNTNNQPPTGGGGGRKDPVTSEILNNIFNFAETAVSAMGIEFSPKPIDTERMISMKFTTTDKMNKIRLFTFDTDELENTQQFVNACNGNVQSMVSGLPGTHLTPVYFTFGFDEITKDLPRDAQMMANEVMGGGNNNGLFESASFGNEEELNLLVNEICNWIKGQPPSNKPHWIHDRPKLTGSAVTVE